jgi:hypothetical protein
MSNYSVLIKALIDAKEIQKQLDSLSGKLTLNLPSLKSGGSDGIKQLADGLERIPRTAKYVQEYLNGTTLASERLNAVGRVTSETFKKTGEEFDVAATKGRNYLNIILNHESAQKRAAKEVASSTKEQQKQAEKVEDNARALNTLRLVLSGLTDEQKKRINVEQRLNGINSLGASNVNKQRKEISALQNDAKAASRGMNTFAATLQYTTERFIQIGIVLGTIRKIKQAISEMIDNVTNLDSALVELKKVTNLSGDSLESFTNTAFKVGETVARTGTEVIEATAIFARSGYDIKDALDLAETALVLLNVGDGIDTVSNAATSLISVLKGYNLEASKAMDVTSLINQVSNTSAINFEDLTEGLTRTSATFNQAGVSIEKTSALLTGAQEILQNIKTKIRYFSYSAYVQKCA